ncbi:MAG: AAA family ATPase [Planctomycetota bacterium]
MLSALELENFKAFGQRARIEFAPITLIFGENSAGKTSILQALNLLKQTRESRSGGAVLLPRAENGIVDLGSFQELLFDHDVSRTMHIKLEFDASVGADQITPIQAFGIELAFDRRSEEEEISLKSLTYYSPFSEGPAFRYTPFVLTKDEQQQILRDILPFTRDRRGLMRRNIRAAKCEWITERPDFWNQSYEVAKDNRHVIAEVFTEMFAAIGQRRETALFEESPLDDTRQSDEFRKALEFYSVEFSLEQFISRGSQGAKDSILGLDGFSPIPLRGRSHSRLPEFLFPRQLTRAIRSSIGQPWLDVSFQAIDISRKLDSVLDALYPLGPFRRPPERWYLFSGTSPQDVGYRGDLLPSLLYRRQDLIEDANHWLQELGIGYSLSVQALARKPVIF